MKTILTIVLTFAAGLALGASPTPAPITPAPVQLVVPAAPPTLITARATIPAALLAANLNAVPVTPQSLLQQLLTLLPLPAGVTPDKIRSEQLTITPTGAANVTVQYVSP